MKVLTYFIFLFPLSLLGQDTVVYCQKSANMYSDCYKFIRVNPNDKKGLFIHKVSTDDGRVWLGKGVFKENKRRFVLTYQIHYDTLTVDFQIDSTIVSDSLLFINKSFCVFPCYSGSPKKPEDAFFYYFSFPSDSSCMSKKTFSEGRFWIDRDTNQFYNIPTTDRLVIISVEYYPPNQITILNSKKKERLRKTKEGFKVKAMWGNKRKELFIKKSKP